jgi:hypothetical protein
MPKLTQALVTRNSGHQRLNRLQPRTVINSGMQDSETTDEPPAPLIEDAGQVRTKIADLTTYFNLTNMQVALSGTNVVHIESNQSKWEASPDVAELHKDIDEEIDVYPQSYRLLDAHFREANWLPELFQN